MRKTQLTIGALVVATAAVFQAIYIVDERETALELRFGEVKEEVRNPGLYFKVPLIDEVVKYDDRILPLDTRKLEVTPADGRRLEVDAFARWRIIDAKEFRRSVGAGGIDGAASRLERILNAELRAVLGKVNSGVVLSADRILLMNQIRDRARSQSVDLGIEVVDVRIKSADLPQQNLEATFERMRAERQRLAADEIARGNEAAQRLRATADRTVVETTSEARKNAQIIRGEADARRNGILAEALGRDAEFYTFLRSLQAYETSLGGDNSSLVISPDSEFFDYLKSEGGRP
ncbi:protease modulator HflC [Aliiroseovarius sp. KMU-50]|uniref:Protein HflC n=1 Tax=Aliiroseovarius salicola TaxID=3009082 RepID=A0ABT4W0F2_9RHOB|nr:protease modulator HflC [Aliiroseovarius sp. KMU-50]MDA5093984.1 protease modulator HflC [Aliiroseovarius sp. KMU-50]